MADCNQLSTQSIEFLFVILFALVFYSFHLFRLDLLVATTISKVDVVYASPPSRCHLTEGGAPRRSSVAPLTAVGPDKTGPSSLPNGTVRFLQFQARASGSCWFHARTAWWLSFPLSHMAMSGSQSLAPAALAQHRHTPVLCELAAAASLLEPSCCLSITALVPWPWHGLACTVREKRKGLGQSCLFIGFTVQQWHLWDTICNMMAYREPVLRWHIQDYCILQWHQTNYPFSFYTHHEWGVASLVWLLWFPPSPPEFEPFRGRSVVLHQKNPLACPIPMNRSQATPGRSLVGCGATV
jgi:hypothetical protein